MRVIYFSQDYTPHDYRFLTKLAESPHEVWYLRFETSPNPLETRPVPSGIRTFDWLGSRTYHLRGRDKIRLFLEFRQALHTLQPDLVHAGPVPTCGFLTALCAFSPLLLMSWGSDILVKPYQNAISRKMAKFTIDRSDLIACDCLAVRDNILELTDYPTDKIVVFPWGVDLNKFNPARSRLGLRARLGWQNKRVVVSSRSFEPIYGIEVFLMMVRKVIQRDPEIRFLMLGDGSLRPMVQNFLIQHNLEDTVYLAGRVNHNLLPDYFNEADLYVSSSYSDGSSVSLLEAMACGLPAVVTDLPSNREWVQPGVNGGLVPPGNPEVLGATILEVLADEAEARTMGEANVATIRQKADWQRNSGQLLAAYERLTGGNGR